MPSMPTPPPAAAATPPIAPAASEGAGASQPKPHRPKASPDWTPRLIQPADGTSKPAVEVAPIAAPPAPKKPQDDFVPRLIAPASETPKPDDNGH